ncbi:LLM class flavin-dependent oxidoreductase [Mycobacterium sp. 1423905.2]|uniref:LLM class flavin-dependent oxidoreductase n=1 Tax=Mycobacterium sp. 1423905.2 TaxID=1856859 RepID=UPI0007FF1620|nr:photosystem I reaction center subunit VIII [Mycobacterium sp. 1423905.2]
MKVGFVSETLTSTFLPTAMVRANYITAVASRVDSFWLPDHLNSLLPRSLGTPGYVGVTRYFPRIEAYLEPWTLLGRVAGWNQVPKLRLGVGVTDSGRRNPAVTAQAAATLHLMTRGRAILGMGTGERVGNEQYGVEWSKPVGRFEEAVATIRALWNSGGELVSRDSPYFRLRNAVFDIPPYAGTWPEIWIAAHGPRMLRITGRYADAWFPGLPQSPAEYAQKLDLVRSAASDAGRDPMTVTPTVWLFVITAKNDDQVAVALSSNMMKVFALQFPAALWKRYGRTHPLGENFSGAQDLVPQSIDARTALEYASQVPDTMVSDWLVTGTPEKALEQLAVWRDHGVRYVVLCNISFLQPSLRNGLASGRAFAEIARRARRL